MKKVFCVIMIIFGLFYLLGCIGSFEQNTMAFGWCLTNAIIAIVIMFFGFRLFGKEEVDHEKSGR